MVKPRENRVPIMMSDDELRAIDDWRFANRIATRSDAVRRLAQIALVLEAEMPALRNAISSASDAFGTSAEAAAAVLTSEAEHHLQVVEDALADMALTTTAGLNEIFRTVHPIDRAWTIMRTGGGETEDAIATQRIAALRDLVEPLQKFVSEYQSGKSEGRGE